MKFLSRILFYLLLSNSIFAQSSSLIKHEVIKGETIDDITTKYNVTTSDIYQLNPDIQKKLKKGTIILIPVKEKIKKVEIKEEPIEPLIKHTVEAKETLYSLSKKYNISISEIEKLNVEVLKDGMKEGSVITIPYAQKSEVFYNHLVKSKETLYSVSKLYNVTIEEIEKHNKILLLDGMKEGTTLIIPQKVVEVKPNNDTVNFHIVEPKDTKYSISNFYKLSIEELEQLNPEIINKEISIGLKLKVSKKEVNKEEDLGVKSNSLVQLYKIQPKETLYSLSTKLDMTQEEIISNNPILSEGVKEGMLIKVQTKKKTSANKREFKDLTKSIKVTKTKKLALLLPFNLSRIEKDTTMTMVDRFKKDKFLNLTLDFYAGALIAIDSVKKMGLKVGVTILDSEESSNSSSVKKLFEEKELYKMDAIIGPFYQDNVENLTNLLKVSQVPVFSPLSKDLNIMSSNLVQTTPTLTEGRDTILEYIKSKNGNILAIIDPKKESMHKFFKEQHSKVSLAIFKENKTLDFVHFKALLVKNKVNYVILETDDSNYLINIVNTLDTWLKEYDIKLVILSKKDSLDYREISVEKLANLNLHYPSITNVNSSQAVAVFESKYKTLYNITPNQFAKRGFDVTFDVLLRLSQENNILETLNEISTEQIENKFDYSKTPQGGYINKKGYYILQYNSDLTIKTVN